MEPPRDPVKPDYRGPNVTGIVPALLGVRPVEWLPDPVSGATTTVLLVLDGLGWRLLESHRDRVPELAALAGGPVTTVVPSTPPAALTSITTGRAPARHGITGFRIREDGAVLNAVRWQRADGRRPPDPVAVQRIEPFLGRPVPVVTRAAFERTGFTGAHLRGGEFHGWVTPAALVEHVRTLARRAVPLVYAYYPGVDEVAHAHGLLGPFLPAELAAVDRLVGDLLDALPPEAALVVTADHGQVEVGPDGWIGLGALDPLVAAYAGDGRFRHLHARPGAARELGAAATDGHSGDAWVFTREQLFDEGWFGPESSGAARRHVGDVVLAARAPVGFVDPTFAQEARLIGAHGSLTADEMLVPLLGGRGRGRDAPGAGPAGDRSR